MQLLLQAAGPLMSDEQNDYSEIFTPTDPRDGCWAEGSGMNSAMSGISGMHIVYISVHICTFTVLFILYLNTLLN